MKIIKFQVRINKTNSNKMIALENHKNQKMNRILYENNENHETIKISLRIMKVMKIIDFHQRITKT